MTTDLQSEFRKCLCEISFTRAGWDYELPPAQKSKEAAMASDCMTRARQIWSENPDKRDDLRSVFTDLQPLAEIREIEKRLAPGSETSLWIEYCEAMRLATGYLPYDDYDDDVPVDADEAARWRAAYEDKWMTA